MSLSQLPPIPAHVTMPSDSDLSWACKRYGVKRSMKLCPVCLHDVIEGPEGTFMTWTAEPFGATSEYQCRCADQVLLRWWFLVRGVDIQWQQARWADAVGVSPATRAAIEPYLSNVLGYTRKGLGLLLHGTSGSGKTLLTMLVAKLLLKAAYDVRVVGASVIGGLNEDWRNSEVREWWTNRVRSSQVLVIDDLGKEFDATWVNERIGDLFRFRGDNMLSTIVSTNLSGEQIRNRYGDYAADTIEERCKPVEATIEMSWRSKRSELLEREVELCISRPAVFE